MSINYPKEKKLLLAIVVQATEKRESAETVIESSKVCWRAADLICSQTLGRYHGVRDKSKCACFWLVAGLCHLPADLDQQQI